MSVDQKGQNEGLTSSLLFLGPIGFILSPSDLPSPTLPFQSVSYSKLRPEVMLPHFQGQIIKGPVTFQGHHWTLITKRVENPDWLPQKPHKRNWGYPQSAMATGTESDPSDFSCNL